MKTRTNVKGTHFPRTATAQTKTKSQLSPELLLLVLLGVTAFIYWPGLYGGFTFDDFHNIVNNPAVHVDTASLHNWLQAALGSPSHLLKRPLAMLSFAVNYHFSGLDPFWLKLTNVFLHLLNGILLFAVLRKLLTLWHAQGARHALAPERAGWLALFVAGAWLVAPINLTAILYVVQRMTSLAELFVLAGFWFYLHGRERQFLGKSGWLWVLAGLGGGVILGLGGKETAVMLPSYALLAEICLLGFRGHGGRRSRWLIALFAVLTLIPALIVFLWLLPNALHGGYDHRPFTMAQRLWTEFRVILDYIHWTLLPMLSQLGFYHDNIATSTGWLNPPATGLSAGVLGLLLVAALGLIRRVPLFSLGILWFFAAHLLTGTFLPLELVFEHRNYFASIGLLLAVMSLLLSLGRRAPFEFPCYLLIFLLVAWPASVTALRAHEWSSPLRLTSSEALKNPDSPRAQYGYARALIVTSDYGKYSTDMLQRARRILKSTMKMPRSSLMPEQALILVAAHKDQPVDPAWWQSMRRKLKASPPSAEDIGALQMLLKCQLSGPCKPAPGPMLHLYLTALSYPNPDNILIQNYAQFALFELHDKKLARRMAQQAIQLAGPSEAMSQVLRKTKPDTKSNRDQKE